MGIVKQIMSVKHLLLIGGDSTTLEQLGQLPIRITYVTNDPSGLTASLHHTVRATHTTAPQSLLTQLLPLHRATPFSGVISFKEEWLELAAGIGELLNIPGNPVRPVILSRDKALFRQELRHSQLGNVPYQLINSATDLIRFQQRIDGPVILKPVKGAGSFGVRLIQPSALSTEAACNALLQDVEHEWMRGSTAQYIAEAFMPGKEFSIEALSKDGQHQIVTITERRIIAEDRFIGKGHIIPANLPASSIIRIHSAVIMMLNMIGQRFGASHTELKIHNNEIYIMETQTRTGGAQIWNLAEMTTGINLRQKAVCDLMDLSYEPASAVCKVAGVSYLHSNPGILEDIIDRDNLLRHDHIHEFQFKYNKGEYMKAIDDSLDRRGFVVVRGPDYPFVHQSLEKIDNNFEFVIRQPNEAYTR